MPICRLADLPMCRCADVPINPNKPICATFAVLLRYCIGFFFILAQNKGNEQRKEKIQLGRFCH